MKKALTQPVVQLPKLGGGGTQQDAQTYLDRNRLELIQSNQTQEDILGPQFLTSALHSWWRCLVFALTQSQPFHPAILNPSYFFFFVGMPQGPFLFPLAPFCVIHCCKCKSNIILANKEEQPTAAVCVMNACTEQDIKTKKEKLQSWGLGALAMLVEVHEGVCREASHKSTSKQPGSWSRDSLAICEKKSVHQFTKRSKC